MHLFGQSADLDALIEICAGYDLPLLEDAAECLGARYRGKPLGTNLALSPDIIKELQEPGRLDDGTAIDYAAGLVVTKYRGLKIVEHAGADAGYKAAMIRFPDQHFSVATLCNLASINPGALNRKITDIYLASELAST